MVDRSTFNEIIKDVLGNLYDTAAIETHPMLFSVLQIPAGYTGSKGEYVRQLILEAINQLKPLRKEESINSPEWRPYYILYQRYVDGMGVQELSDQLAISPRQMRRDHHRAFLSLTEILWSKYQLATPTAENEPEPPSSRAIEIHKEIVDLVDTAYGVYKTLRRRFDEKKITVSITPAESLSVVVTDRVILRQALIGIFNESLHIQNGNSLSIHFHNEEQAVVIDISAPVSSAWESASEEEIDDDLNAVRYWCRFIDAELQEKVSQKNGQKQIEWLIKLPLASKNILLVIDDQPAVLNLFKRYLSQSAVYPVGVEQANQAFSLAQHLQPAVITLDVMMPQMDGWELLQTLKLDAHTSHIPIIICSAWDDPDLSRTLGAAAFLKKPVTQKMLLEAIEQVLPHA
jgi:CheY-like chemotaxis protein